MDDDSGGGFTTSSSSSSDSVKRVDVYDSAGRLISPIDYSVTKTTDFGGQNQASDPAAGPATSEPLSVMEPILQLFRHTFEFRLSGSEEKWLAINLPPISAGACMVATIDRVRAFVTGSGEAAASTPIGGIEVWTERRPKTAELPETLVCVAQASDFGPNDLVVIQVDVTVHCVHCGGRSS
jgi:hypothetical protein